MAYTTTCHNSAKRRRGAGQWGRAIHNSALKLPLTGGCGRSGANCFELRGTRSPPTCRRWDSARCYPLATGIDHVVAHDTDRPGIWTRGSLAAGFLDLARRWVASAGRTGTYTVSTSALPPLLRVHAWMMRIPRSTDHARQNQIRRTAVHSRRRRRRTRLSQVRCSLCEPDERHLLSYCGTRD
jgi:hypothetical protein